MMKRIDADKLYRSLHGRMKRDAPGVFPRQRPYGYEPGLVAFGEAYPDKLVDPADYKEVIKDCHADEVFPFYHQRATWAPSGKRWNQNGLNYCWAWAGTAALMDCEAREGKDVVELAPVTCGWMVRWKNDGNYLADVVAGMKSRGVAPASYVDDPHDTNYRKFKDGWEEAAFAHRLLDAWDADNSTKASLIRYAISILGTGTSGLCAWHWMGHAQECAGVRWDESQANNLVWLIRNSHDEDDIIEMVGDRAVPDEFYGYVSTLTVT
jgi:hypothetical protein